MDNLSSQPTLNLPTVPADFDARAGTSRRDMAVALLALLQSTTISGINQDNPAGYDLAALTALVLSLQDEVNTALEAGVVTKVTFAGVDDDSVTLNFADIGTSSYELNINLILPSDVTLVNWSWALINGSKTPTSCQIRMKNAGTFNCIAYIRKE